MSGASVPGERSFLPRMVAIFDKLDLLSDLAHNGKVEFAELDVYEALWYIPLRVDEQAWFACRLK